jgi:hypothetical protein
MAEYAAYGQLLLTQNILNLKCGVEVVVAPVDVAASRAHLAGLEHML